MYQLFSIKNNSSKRNTSWELIAMNTVCTAPLMLREWQQYQMQAPVMLQPQCREIVRWIAPNFSVNHAYQLCWPLLTRLSPEDRGSQLFILAAINFFGVCLYSHGGSLMKFHRKECDVGRGYRFTLEGQVKKYLLITCLYWYSRGTFSYHKWEYEIVLGSMKRIWVIYQWFNCSNKQR